MSSRINDLRETMKPGQVTPGRLGVPIGSRTAHLIRHITAHLIRSRTAHLIRSMTAHLIRSITAHLIRPITAHLIGSITAHLIRSRTAHLIRPTYPRCPSFTAGCSWCSCSCPECGEPIGAQVALNWNSLGITSFIQVRRFAVCGAVGAGSVCSALRDAGLRARRTRTATRPSSSSRATSTRCRRARARSSRSSR